MTRDEHRRACIIAMNDALYERTGTRMSYGSIAYIFDALPTAGVRVCPIEATDEMLNSAALYFGAPLTAYETIAAAGDLTKPPERKP